MAQTYWDPKNLLQITDDDNTNFIQCIGRDRYGKRCKWDVASHDRSTAYSLLAQMSSKKPGDASAAELLQLATLCLCPNYHKRQCDQVARRWAVVVDTAVRHYDIMTQQSAPSSSPDRFARGLTPESEETISLKLDLLRAREETNATVKANEGLQKDLVAAQHQRDSAYLCLAAFGVRVGRLETESAQLQKQAQQAEDQKSSLESHAKTVEAEVSRLSTIQLALEKEKIALQARFQAVDDSLSSRNAQLEEAQQQAESLRAETDRLNANHAAMADRIGQLETDSAAANSESRRLAVELEASRQAEQQSRRELEDKQRGKARKGSSLWLRAQDKYKEARKVLATYRDRLHRN